MSIDAGVSIVVSFGCFAWIFVKKVLPLVLSALDEYIDGIKNKLSSVEREKEEALDMVKKSQLKQQEIFKSIDAERARSRDRIQQLSVDNDRELVSLREQYQAALKTKVDAEVSKQRNAILNQLSDIIIDELSEKIRRSNCGSVPTISKNDLKRLI